MYFELQRESQREQPAINPFWLEHLDWHAQPARITTFDPEENADKPTTTRAEAATARAKRI